MGISERELFQKGTFLTRVLPPGPEGELGTKISKTETPGMRRGGVVDGSSPPFTVAFAADLLLEPSDRCQLLAWPDSVQLFVLLRRFALR